MWGRSRVGKAFFGLLLTGITLVSYFTSSCILLYCVRAWRELLALRLRGETAVLFNVEGRSCPEGVRRANAEVSCMNFSCYI